MNLSFSTVACPGWSLARVASAAHTFGYEGIELRVLDGKVVEPSTLIGRSAEVLDTLGDIKVASIDTSIALAVDGPEWAGQLEEFCASAAAVGAPVVRVWGGRYPSSVRYEEAVEQVSKRLNEAAFIAEAASVKVLLETHDAFSALSVMEDVFANVPSPDVGVLWDVHNTYAVGKSSPHEVWSSLGDRIAQIHVKDARPGAGELWDPVLLGFGAVPVRESVETLKQADFGGWLSLNWLKFQRPELEEPEIALPQYSGLLREWSK